MLKKNDLGRRKRLHQYELRTEKKEKKLQAKKNKMKVDGGEKKKKRGKSAFAVGKRKVKTKLSAAAKAKAELAMEIDKMEHPMLRFNDNKEFAKFSYTSRVQYGANRYLDWNLLDQLGLSDQLRAWTSVGDWGAIFGIREDTFSELTIEFLTTYKLIGKNREHDNRRVVQFRMGGQRYSMSIDELTAYLGIPVPGPLHVNARFCKFPVGMDASRVWALVTTNEGDYIPSRAKASKLRTPALRVLQRLLAFTINGRARSVGGCTAQDLLCIYSMTQDYRIHLGYLLANGILLQGTRLRDKTTFAGPFITRLAKGMGVFGNLPQLTRVESMVPLSGGQLTRAGIAIGYAFNNRTFYTLPGAPPPFAGARPMATQGSSSDDDDVIASPVRSSGASSTPFASPSHQASLSHQAGPSYIQQDQLATLRAELRQEIDALLDERLHYHLSSALAGIYDHFGIPRPPQPLPPPTEIMHETRPDDKITKIGSSSKDLKQRRTIA